MIQPSHPVTELTGTGQSMLTPIPVIPIMTMPMITETIGPPMAMKNSALALGGSSVISATPPKINRVMPRICIPNRRATTECPSS